MSFNFDRRTFLKGAGAVGAASLLAACGEEAYTTEQYDEFAAAFDAATQA